MFEEFVRKLTRITLSKYSPSPQQVEDKLYKDSLKIASKRSVPDKKKPSLNYYKCYVCNKKSNLRVGRIGPFPVSFCVSHEGTYIEDKIFFGTLYTEYRVRT